MGDEHTPIASAVSSCRSSQAPSGLGDEERPYALSTSADLNRGVALMFGYLYLLGEFIAEIGDVSNDAYRASRDLKALDGLRHRCQGIRIEGAEALVDEQAVEMHGPCRFLDLPADLQGKRQRREKRLAAAQRVADACLAGVVVVYDEDLIVLELQRVSLPGQREQTVRGSVRQLGKALFQKV